MNQVWLADIRQFSPDIEARLSPMLSRTERQKLNRLQHAARRKEYILSRTIMRMALTEAYTQPYEYWQFSESDNAAPCLENPLEETLLISLSHSTDYVVLAMSDQAVGIDIEYARPRNRTLSIARKVFTPEQQATLAGLPETQAEQEFFKLWTRKEALVKAMAGTRPSFQMISTADWPLQGFHFSQAYHDRHQITLAAQNPASDFEQFQALAFSQIERYSLF